MADLLADLGPVRLHFGWRVVDDILDFLELSLRNGRQEPFGELLDQIVYAKVLPKLRGNDSKRMRTAFEACLESAKRHGLKKSARKIEELRDDLLTTGSARFWR